MGASFNCFQLVPKTPFHARYRSLYFHRIELLPFQYLQRRERLDLAFVDVPRHDFHFQGEISEIRVSLQGGGPGQDRLFPSAQMPVENGAFPLAYNPGQDLEREILVRKHGRCVKPHQNQRMFEVSPNFIETEAGLLLAGRRRGLGGRTFAPPIKAYHLFQYLVGGDIARDNQYYLGGLVSGREVGKQLIAIEVAQQRFRSKTPGTSGFKSKLFESSTAIAPGILCLHSRFLDDKLDFLL